MKRLFAFAKVKNDGDIIESFCRYYMHFLDGMLICDDNSEDATTDIIESLVCEGLNITLIHRRDYPRNIRNPDLQFFNQMISMIFDKYNADIVLPLDADEFLYSVDGRSPRCVLETMDERIVLKVKRRNAIFNVTPDDSTVFLPDYFFEYIDEKCDINGHVIITRYLYEKLGGQIGLGKHCVVFPSIESFQPPVELVSDQLYFAHYSITGPLQYTLKIVAGWLVFQLFNIPGAANHWRNTYEIIKKQGTLTSNQAHRLSMYMLESYGVREEDYPQYIHKESRRFIRADFPDEPIRLKYTDYNYTQKHYWNLVLSHFETLLDLT